MTWTQVYTPVFNSLVFSALVAALPVVVLLGLLAFFHVRAHLAALAGLVTALLIALLVYGMPVSTAVAAAVNGAAFGLFPIGWIILAAIFVYDITVHTGKFEIIKRTIATIADDRRIQLLLIAFSFGAFIEGAAGFGTPVAISAAMLIGLGFRPLPAAGLALIGNTAPVAFGALGTPLLTLATITSLPLDQLTAMVGRQLPFFSVIVPFWLVWAMAGWRSTWEVWPACLVTGVSFAIMQFLVSNFIGPQLVDIIGALVSIGCMVVFLRFWQPKTIWRFPGEAEPAEVSASETGTAPGGASPAEVSPAALERSDFDEQNLEAAPVSGSEAVSLTADTAKPSRREAWVAWSPWIILAVVLFFWGGGITAFKDLLNGIGTPFKGILSPGIPVPFLDKVVLRAPPVVAEATAEAAVFSFNWLAATGTGLLLTGIISGFLLGLKPLELIRIFGGTFKRLRFSLMTIAAMLALGYTTRYGGLDATMGLAFASTGFLFPFFSPMLGWLGVALTGSDTSSNVLFGSLQRITAEQLGISPILAAASNSSGGVMGKMIDAQSIVVAGVATGQQGGEGDILRYVFLHSLVLAALVGVLVLLQAYVFPWMIPS